MKKVEVEQYLKQLGWRNKWILFWFIIISATRNFATSFSMLSFQFTATIPKSYHCKLAPNISIDDQIPKQLVYGKMVYSKCEQYINKSISNRTTACNNGYDYVTGDMKSSTVIDWSLFCDRAYLNSLANGAFFSLSFLGSIVSCTLADKFGRSTIFLISFTGLNITEILIGLLPTVYVHIVLKMLAGIFQQGCFVIGLTMIVEMFSIAYRPNFCLFDTLTWPISCIILDLIAFLLRNQHWSYYYIATSLLIQVPFMFLYCMLPESICWLFSKHRNEEAKALVLKAGQYSNPPLTEKVFEDMQLNKMSINEPEDITDVPEVKVITEYNFTHIFRDSLMLRYQIVNSFIFFTVGLTFYGIQIKVVEIGNTFLNFLLSVLVEVPANFYSFPLVSKFGRKIIISIFFVMTVVFVLAGFLSFLYTDNKWLTTILFLIAKMINNGVFVIIFMYMGEFFPTTLRSTALGLCSSSARLGAATAALLFQNDELIVFAFILSIILNSISGIIVFTLPETYRLKLPNTIDEVKQWNRGKRMFRFR